jgi:hypothetical protein
MNRVRRLQERLRRPSPWTCGETLVWILLLGTSRDVGMFLVRHQWADTAFQWILGAAILAMIARIGWLNWRRRRHS